MYSIITIVPVVLGSNPNSIKTRLETRCQKVYCEQAVSVPTLIPLKQG